MLGYTSWKQFRRSYTIILAAAVVSFLVRLAKFDEFGFILQIKILFVSIVAISIEWEALRLVNLYLNRVYPFEKNLTGRISIQLLIGTVFGLIFRLALYWWGEPSIPFKLDSLFVAATWAIYAILPIGINLGFFTIYFIDRWKDSLVKAERLEKEKSQVQFDNLKNQLNPHFLFNALTSLNSLIFENQQLASAFVQQLAKVYRYVLQNKEKNFVILQAELDFIDHYILLLKTRFQTALEITFKINEQAKEKVIVPVTLQILIENAIKHNIVDKDRVLSIEIITTDDYLIVSNNLQLKRNLETSNKQGLDNLKSLYKFLTDRPVVIEQTPERFFVKIPLM